MKKLLYFAVCMAFILSLLGCAKTEVPADMVESALSSQSEPEKEKEPSTVAICMGAIDHPVHRIVQTGFMLKAEELGMKGVISGKDEASMQEMQSKWDSDIQANNAVGILLWTGDDSCYELMKKWKSEGRYTVVPHFIHDYKTTKDFIDKNISTSGFSQGQNAADYIVNKLQELGITEGSIGLTRNGPGVSTNSTLEGFRARMAELDTNYTVLEDTLEGAEINEATKQVTKYIEENPDMVALLGTTGGSPLSFANAIENTGRSDLITVGYDYTEENMKVVEQGIVTGLMIQPLYKEGQECAQALYDLNNGAVFNTDEETWFTELEPVVAEKDDMPYYRDIWQKMYDYFGLV